MGANSGLVEDLYERFQENPDAIPERWRLYFQEHGAPPPARGPPPPLEPSTNGDIPAPIVGVLPPASAGSTAPAGEPPGTQRPAAAPARRRFQPTRIVRSHCGAPRRAPR